MNLVVGKVSTHPRGFGFVVPDKPLEGVTGDIFIAGANLNQAMHGDRVVARIERRQRGPRRGAHRPHPRTRFRDDCRRFDVDDIRPGLRRAVRSAADHGREIPPTSTDGAARATWSSSRSPAGRRRRAARSGRVLEVLGDIDEPGVDTEIIIRKYGITDAHSDEAVEEATRSAPR